MTADPVAPQHENDGSSSCASRREGLRPREAVLNHPLFAEARRLHMQLHAQSHLPDNFPGRLKVDIRNVMLFGLIVTGDAMAEESRPEDWLTPARLKSVLQQFDMDGQRRIDDTLGRLIQISHVQFDSYPGDRRMRLVRPLEPLRVWFVEWMQAYFAPLDILFPGAGFERMRDPSPRLLKAFLNSATRNHHLSYAVLAANPRLANFLRYDRALLVLNTMIGLRDETPSRLMREIDLRTALQHHGLSRSHLRNILATALENGYAERSGLRLQYWSISAEGLAAVDGFLADSLVTCELNVRGALQTVDAPPPA